MSASSRHCLRDHEIRCGDVTDIVIRRAGDADLAAIAALRSEWTLEWDGAADDPGFAQRFAEWFERESERRITWLAETDGRAVGMMNLAVFDRMPRPGQAPSSWGYLANAFVLSAYRDRGIGGKLLDALLGYADAHHFARVVLSPSQRAIPFYERAGFEPANSLLLRTLPG
jgi:GNAT superfamily N-acetyltransferase